MEKSPSNLFPQINNINKREDAFVGTQVLPFHRSLLKLAAELGIPEQNQAVPSSVASTGLVGSSLRSREGSLSRVDTEVLNPVAQGACDGRTVECKHA